MSEQKDLHTQSFLLDHKVYSETAQKSYNAKAFRLSQPKCILDGVKPYISMVTFMGQKPTRLKTV
jgi:hypothetical protein